MLLQQLPWLSLSIWSPVLFGVLVLFFKRTPTLARWLALSGAIVSLLVTIPLMYFFDVTNGGQWQFVESFVWIKTLNVHYALAIDGISLWLILLTALVTVLVVLAGWKVDDKQIAQFMSAFLILSGLMIGVFSTRDALLFYLFFEATLVPMYLIIGIWGGARRIYASMKLFLYTLTGSVLMLVAMAYLFFKSQGSFDLSLWSSMRFNEKELFWLFLAFFAAFAVKIPMWPFHTWLPDAHVEAPTTGSMVLAAIMLKLGAYGFIRFNVPVLLSSQSLVAFDLSMMVIILSLIAIVYISFVALVQEDMKKLVAYSSIAHMGFVTLGIFLLTENSFNSQRVEFLVPNAITGAVVQMISHGFVSAAMFFCIGVLYDRVHSRQISDYGGVMTVMPRFGAFFILFAMANCGLPGTSGFVGELLVLVSAIGSNWLIGAIAATSIILSAAYSLWLVKRILFGPVKRPEIQTLKDLDGREFFILSVLAFFVILLGVYPQLMIQTINGAVESLMTTVQL